MPKHKTGRAEKINISQIKKEKRAHSSTPKAGPQDTGYGVQTQFSWTAPERIWFPKDKAWYLSYAAVTLLIILFLILSRYPAYPFLILVLIAFLGLWFAQAAIPPHIQQHRILSKGVYTYDGLYTWQEIGRFWIANKKGQMLLHLDFPPALRQPRITLLISAQDTQRIFNLLIEHVNYGSSLDIEYNVFTKMLYGEYQPISKFISDLDMPDATEDN